LDGGHALRVVVDDLTLLIEHARKILPRMGYGALLAAFDASTRFKEAEGDRIPLSLAENRRQTFSLYGRDTPEAIALPDAHWAAVGTFLRKAGREGDVIVSPDEYRFLCESVRRETIPDRGWGDAPQEAVIVLHKGRLDMHDLDALASVAASVPIFANEVFAVYSRTGTPLPNEDRVHLGLLEVAAVAAA
jgi:hypothetical protein